MSVNNSEMIAFQKVLEALQNDIPEIMDRIVVQEGEYAVKQARKICKEEGIVNQGTYRRNFKCGTKAIRAGRAYKIDVYNNLDYAEHLEYGFRAHFVPGHWEGSSFVYQKNDPKGGMVMPGKKTCPSGYYKGHYTLKRAIDNTKRSQDRRIERKYLQELKKRGLDKYMK